MGKQTDPHPSQYFGDRTYAQHGDDIMFLAMFHRLGIERPSYIDIGAFDPWAISNTALLYERGCRGINCEANPALIEAFKRERPDDINLCCGVAPERGRMLFYIALNPGLSSFIKEVAAEAGIAEVRSVPVWSFSDIIIGQRKGECPDLLSIDIEGMDLAVLSSIDFATYSPKVICVEGVPSGRDHSDELHTLLCGRGYFLHSWAGVNMIFAREIDRPRLCGPGR